MAVTAVIVSLDSKYVAKSFEIHGYCFERIWTDIQRSLVKELLLKDISFKSLNVVTAAKSQRAL